MIFGCFIRNTLEMSQFFIISSINEIYDSNTTNSNRFISFLFAICMLLFYLLIIGVVSYLALSSYRLNENEHNKLEEVFRGMKLEKKHKFYVSVLLFRRLIFVVLIVTLTSLLSRILAVILTVIQAVYIIYL